MIPRETRCLRTDVPVERNFCCCLDIPTPADRIWLPLLNSAKGRKYAYLYDRSFFFFPPSKGFKFEQSLSLSVMSVCEVSCYNISTLTAARPYWVTSYEVSGSLLPTSVSSHITSFPPLTCTQDWPYFTAQHDVAKDNTENSDLCFS